MLRLLPGSAAASPGALFSTVSAPACHKLHIFPMNFNDSILCFSKSCCGSHSGYIFDIASTYRKSCDQPRSTKIWSMQLLHVFLTYLQCFYISATQHQFVEGTNHTTDLSQHEALKGAHVRQVTLCVAFGALLCGTIFNVLRLCSKSSTIRMLFWAHLSARPH